MKKRIYSAFAVFCSICLLSDFCYDASRSHVVVDSDNNGSVTAGVLSATVVDMNTLSAISIEESDIAVTALAEDGTFCGYTNLGICTVSEGNLNVRQEPVEGSHVVGKFPKNAGCEVLGFEGDWVQIQSGKVTGYVSADYIVTGAEALAMGQQLATLTATSNTGGLNIRTEPNTNCTVLAQMGDGEEVEVIEDLGDWVAVDCDGETGYVFAEYVDVALSLTHAMTIEEVRFGTGVSQTRADLCTYALQFVGNPYVWGGTSLTKGADCSGFVLSVYAHYGISLPHYSGAQSKCGTRINASQLQPGDLIFYGSGKSIGHVAIYIGGGQIVHAANKRDGIKISSAYYRTPICYARILSN